MVFIKENLNEPCGWLRRLYFYSTPFSHDVNRLAVEKPLSLAWASEISSLNSSKICVVHAIP